MSASHFHLSFKFPRPIFGVLIEELSEMHKQQSQVQKSLRSLLHTTLSLSLNSLYSVNQALSLRSLC